MTRISKGFVVGLVVTYAFDSSAIARNLHFRERSITAVTQSRGGLLDFAAMNEALMSHPNQASLPPGQPHVLVVDDDPTIRELVTDYLAKNELRVTAVADGRAMQAVLAEAGGHLGVLDLKLPAE